MLALVRAFEEANRLVVPYVMDARRPGDVAACWADPSKAERSLGWKAERSVLEMCRDAWRFASGKA